MTGWGRSCLRAPLVVLAVCTLGGCVGPGLEPPGRGGQSAGPGTAGAGGAGGSGTTSGAGSFGNAGTTAGAPMPPTAGSNANGSAGVGALPGVRDDAGVDHDDSGATH